MPHINFCHISLSKPSTNLSNFIPKPSVYPLSSEYKKSRNNNTVEEHFLMKEDNIIPLIFDLFTLFSPRVCILTSLYFPHKPSFHQLLLIHLQKMPNTCKNVTFEFFVFAHVSNLNIKIFKCVARYGFNVLSHPIHNVFSFNFIHFFFLFVYNNIFFSISQKTKAVEIYK